MSRRSKRQRGSDGRTGPARPPFGGLAHPDRIAMVAVVGLLGSWAIAIQDPVPGWELDLTELINGLPDAAATALYPIMQMGTLAGPVVVAGTIAIWKRDWLLSAAAIGTGLAAWFAAKGVKKIVGRDRPGSFLDELDIREGDGTGLGFVSGHSAVAAAAAIVLMAVVPPRWRPAVALVPLLVGVARVVHGVHLPADVVGGWSLGALIGLAGLGLVDLIDRRLAGPGTGSPAEG